MKNYTLYRVNSHIKTVDFIINIADEELNSAEVFAKYISTPVTFSFDEILLQLEQFRIRYERLKDFAGKTIEYITKGQDVNVVLTNEYTMLSEKENNFFAKYYLEKLWEIYTVGRKNLNKITGFITNAMTNSGEEKAYRNQLNNIAAEMEQLIITDWFYNHIPDTSNRVIQENIGYVVLRGNGVNEMYRVTELSLLPFLYEYSFCISSIGMQVYECSYCHKHYLSVGNNVCCGDEKCLSQKKKDIRKGKKDEFSNIKKGYCGYVRGLKHKLTEAKKSKYAIDLFTDAQNKAEKYVSNAIEEYRDSGKRPDADFDDVITSAKNAMRKLTNRLYKMSDSATEEIYCKMVEGDVLFEVERLMI
ncbi:MAG: hypothetical protein J6K17_02415 [Oscillospiraceae bacterium]|nr:hypothetical protein [Oscillospiraceae bacterium]